MNKFTINTVGALKLSLNHKCTFLLFYIIKGCYLLLKF